MIQDKTPSAENGCSLIKDGEAVLNHLASSLRARRTLRQTASRLAESVNITLKEYKSAYSLINYLDPFYVRTKRMGQI